MSTRGTVYVAVNGVNAGVTSPEDAKTTILDHIRLVLEAAAPELSIDTLEQIALQTGCAFETRAGRINCIRFC